MVEADQVTQIDSTNGPLTQNHDEVGSHFKMRQTVYARALQAGKTPEQASLMATVFRNCYFMGCGYSEEVM